jgi:hypothetical protein
MKTLLAFLLFPLCLFGQPFTFNDTAFMGNLTAAASSAYLIDEDFEGTGAPSVWTTIGGLPDWDHTDTPLEGSQSCWTNSINAYINYDFGANYDTLSIYFIVSITNAPASSIHCVAFQNDGTNLSSFYLLTTSGSIRVYNGTVNSTAAGVLNYAEAVYVWMDYTKGTGADGITRIYMSNTSSKPGTVTVERVNGNAMQGVKALKVRFVDTGMLIDKIRVSTSILGNGGVP